MANTSMTRRQAVRNGALIGAGAVLTLWGVIEAARVWPSSTTPEQSVSTPQASEVRKFSKLEELAFDVSHRIGGQYAYSGNLPERRYDEVDFNFLDSMLLNDAVMTGPDTGPLIQAKIEKGRIEALQGMPQDEQYIMQGADLSKGARVYLKYIPTGQAHPSSETYDPSNSSDLVVSLALYNQPGETIKRPFAPISLKDLTYIFNPKCEKEITWQVMDGTRIVYNNKLVG